MYYVNKITASETADYAAEELKKYIRMMRPEGGDVKISYDKDGAFGFRLGLMSDFGLDTSDAVDITLDDIIYIDCREDGGIIAGSNQRSILLAVYEYLRQEGCRWLFPGVDGEYIPIKELTPVKYRYKPSCRYRGICNEGGEWQNAFLSAIEFMPKVGLNTFCMQFRIPVSYYRRYYMHNNNEMNRPPENITNDQILQWRRACECEIAKRGMYFHDVGHGWSADAFGIDSSLRPWDGDNDSKVPVDMRQYLALIDGRRGIVSNAPIHTNFCMSNAKARELVIKCAAEYALKHGNVDCLHIWLADGNDNSCQCDACRRKSPSDWYVVLLNEMDREFSRLKIDMKIGFITYSDTVWPPISEKIENPSRFMIMPCPISRSYCETLPKTPSKIEIKPFMQGHNELPKNLEETFAYFKAWESAFVGKSCALEYHFWYHQYFDPAGLSMAKLIVDDVKAYKENRVDGMIEDGSQRSFFPSGFAFYTFARSVWNTELTYDDIVLDYFPQAYGKEWRAFYDFLEKLGKIYSRSYFEREMSADPEVSLFYNPEFAKGLCSLDPLLDEGLDLIKKNYNSDVRVTTVSVRLLEYFITYCRLLKEPLKLKAQARDEEALTLFEEFCAEFGKREVEIDPYYDHGTAMMAIRSIFNNKRSKEPNMVNEGDVQ